MFELYHTDQFAPSTVLGRYLRVRPFYCSCVVALHRWAERFPQSSSNPPHLGPNPKHWQFFRLARMWTPRIPGAILHPYVLHDLLNRAEAFVLNNDGLYEEQNISFVSPFSSGNTTRGYGGNSNSRFGAPRFLPISTYYGNAYPTYMNAYQAQYDQTRERMARFFVQVNPVYDDIANSPINSLGNGQMYVSGDTWLDESGIHFQPNVFVHGESVRGTNRRADEILPHAISTSRSSNQLSITVCPVKSDFTGYSSAFARDTDFAWQNSTPVLPFTMNVIQARWRNFITNRFFLASGLIGSFHRGNTLQENGYNWRVEDSKRLNNPITIGGWFTSQDLSDPNAKKTLTVCAKEKYAPSTFRINEPTNSQCIFSAELPGANGVLPDTFAAMSVGMDTGGTANAFFACGGMPNENIYGQVLKEGAANYLARQEVTFFTGSTLTDDNQHPQKYTEPGFYNCYPVNDATWKNGVHTKERIAYVEQQNEDGYYQGVSQEAKVFSNQINYYTAGHLPINVGDSYAPVSSGTAKAGSKTINGCSVRFIEIPQETIQPPTYEDLYGKNLLPYLGTRFSWLGGWTDGSNPPPGNRRWVKPSVFIPYEQREPPGWNSSYFDWNTGGQYPALINSTDFRFQNISAIVNNTYVGSYTVQDYLYDSLDNYFSTHTLNEEYLIPTLATFSSNFYWGLNFELYQWMYDAHLQSYNKGLVDINSNNHPLDGEQLTVIQRICPKMIQGTYQFTPFNHGGIDSNENLFRCIAAGPSVPFEHSIPLQLWTDNGPQQHTQTTKITVGELETFQGVVLSTAFPDGEPTYPGNNPSWNPSATQEEIDAYKEALEAYRNTTVIVTFLTEEFWPLEKSQGYFKTTGIASTPKIEAYCQLGWADAKAGVDSPSVAATANVYDQWNVTAPLEKNRPPPAQYSIVDIMPNDELNLYNNYSVHDDGEKGGIPVLNDDDFKQRLTVNIAIRSEHSLSMRTEFRGASGLQITNWPHTLNPSRTFTDFGNHTYFHPGGGDVSHAEHNQYANIKTSESFSPLSFATYDYYQANLTVEQTETVLLGGEVILDPLLTYGEAPLYLRSAYQRRSRMEPKYQVAISLT